MSSTSSSRRASAIARRVLVALGIALACGVPFSASAFGLDDDEGGVVTANHPAAPCEADLDLPAPGGVSVDEGDGDDHDDGHARSAGVTLLPPPPMALLDERATDASPDRRRPRREPAVPTGPPSATNALHP